MTTSSAPHTRAPSDNDVWMEAIARSAIYALLSHTVAYPTAERIDALKTDLRPFLTGIEVDGAEIDVALADLLRQLDTPIADVQHAHTMQFSHIVSPDCPTNETAYSVRDVFQQAQTMADIAGFFHAHGVQVGGRERERPDHIGAELEFISFMARKEAQALRAGEREHIDECQRTQATFLRDHLGCWGSSLGRRIDRLALSPFYAATGTLLNLWLQHDMATLGVTPQRDLDEPLPQPPPEDEDAPCGVAGGMEGGACGPLSEQSIPSDQLIDIDEIK